MKDKIVFRLLILVAPSFANKNFHPNASIVSENHIAKNRNIYKRPINDENICGAKPLTSPLEWLLKFMFAANFMTALKFMQAIAMQRANIYANVRTFCHKYMPAMVLTRPWTMEMI